jgi:hypothetical protein
MPRLPLILCALALIGSALSAVLYFQIGNSKLILEQRLSDAQMRVAKTEGDLAKTNEQNGVLKNRLVSAQATLDEAKSKLAASDARNLQLDRELAGVRTDLSSAKDVLGLYEQTARALADDVAILRRDLAESRASNASPEAVAAYKNAIAELERQLATARNGAALPAVAGASTAVFSSRAGRATVLTVGPENSFVVLNFGSARGAEIGQKMTVSQGPRDVAIVLLSDVRANHSVAQVMPETLRGVLQKGDLAVLIR